ncbi:nitrilase-related carbon-nitrogen hydrolase [Paenirhodobacter sp.]|uniref:nitrilase-related carbon-nitrogen hydrolase n=1 Tax=Paenirhodobacter sp. TaxID=1965326 RepID=UPI003B3E78A6
MAQTAGHAVPGGVTTVDFERVAGIATDARRQGVELIVFPERALTGTGTVGLRRNGPERATMVRLLRGLGLAIVAGFAEAAEDGPDNAAFLVAGGNIRGISSVRRRSRPGPPGEDWVGSAC